MWQIDKRFDFCYGHRVYTQKLNSDFCENNDDSCKCKHPHGHQGAVHVFLEADTLDDQGMVTDFKHLGWLKNWIDDHIDHKFIISNHDPMFDVMVNYPFMEYENNALDWSVDVNHVYVDGFHAGWELTLRPPQSQYETSIHELLSGYFIVDFVPTSENLSKWMGAIVSHKMSMFSKSFRVNRIEWFETPKSRSTFLP